MTRWATLTSGPPALLHQVAGRENADTSAYTAEVVGSRRTTKRSSPRLRMARQRAVGEPADVGFVDDVHHPARRGQKTHAHHQHRVDDGDLGAGLHAQAGSALHAPVHDRVGGLLETLLARADLTLDVLMVVSGGQLAGRGRAHLRVSQRKLLERFQVHLLSLPRQDARSRLRRTVVRVTAQKTVAQASGTFTLGGDLTVNRLGFGAMRITGKGVWGPPADRDECVRVLRRAVELGVNFIDTADSYGPYISEEIIHEALHPYDGLVIATKAGLLRTGPGHLDPAGQSELPAPGMRDEPAPPRRRAPSTSFSCTASTATSRWPTRSASCSR